MEILVLTCPQCGSSAVKLLPERNDLAQCNYCSALFILAATSSTEEAKPKITEVKDEKEEEKVDMTEVVYPIKPAPPFAPVIPFILAGCLAIVSGACGINALFQWKPDHQKIAFWGILFLIGAVAFLISLKNINDKQKEYQSSEEMQEYLKQKRAAVDKSWAQFKQRGRQKK
ncbi:hypothetical protein [Chitinophaga arvensicola]|uniref:Uncharacterized protein n=1 Tax=Chitinophaga arvensicola TaxID=29529 RepID=A0A1I0SAX4_9BACT|nr:hypothetical protein [Chitinophaga arvensicola]SEW53723.1 hypothetical protein SAMN04488122_5650 [Chitinophaga arvensicola]